MRMSSEFFKGFWLIILKNVTFLPMHTLKAHFDYWIFGETVFAIEALIPPTIDVIYDNFFLKMARVSELNHANNVSSILEAIQEFMLELIPAFNLSWLKINIPIKFISFKWANKLLPHEVTICSRIIARLYKVRYMFSWFTFSIKFWKIWWLVLGGHHNHVNLLGVQLFCLHRKVEKLCWHPLEIFH